MKPIDVIKQKIAEHARYRERPSFKGAQASLDRLTQDFCDALRFGFVMMSRAPHIYDQGLWNRSTDEFLESAVANLVLAQQGAQNPVRRELRYMLEAAIKYLAVDQQWDLKSGTMHGRPGALSDRLDYFHAYVQRRSLEDVLQRDSSEAALPEIQVLYGDWVDEFAADAWQLYKELCAYVHPSRHQIDRRMAAVKRGRTIGFETEREIEDVSRLMARTYDITLACYLIYVGPPLTGDMFTSDFDGRNWRYHRTAWVARISSSFDYKQERKARQNGE